MIYSNKSNKFSIIKEYKDEKKERNISSNDASNQNGNEKVRLVPGYDVFISTNDLNACNDDRGSATRLLRNLIWSHLKKFFFFLLYQ